MRQFKTYQGMPLVGGHFDVSVIENGKHAGALDENLGLIDFGSGGFSWGLDHRGGNQLALALLSNVLDKDQAITLYEPFRRLFFDFIPPYEPWQLCTNTVAAIAQSCERRFIGSCRNKAQPEPAAGLPIQEGVAQ